MNAAVPTPFDVRLMNFTAGLLYGLFGFMVLAAALWWGVRHPAFSIAGITVQGDVAHNSAVTLRANVAPRLAGNFFTVNLAATRAAFEAVPWVRRAVVRREFPNRLKVVLQEHQPVALWGAESESKLVNGDGEVFEANAADAELEDLPRLAGPEDQAPQVLAMYRALRPVFEALDMPLVQLTLSGRGGWSGELDTGAELQLGRGSVDDVVARSQRFAQSITQVASKYGRRAQALVSADLRHADGFALKLRGVTTVAAEPKK